MPYTYTYGAGTEQDPYQVWDADDLDGVRDHLDKHFVQKANIDFQGWGSWNPVGDWGAGYRFEGTYEGDNFLISNLLCDKVVAYGEAEYHASLFGYMQGATLKNIRLKDSYLSGEVAGTLYTSLSSGGNNVSNCHVDNVEVHGLTVLGAFGAVSSSIGGVKNYLSCCTVENADLYVHDNHDGNFGGFTGETGNIEMYCCFVEGRMRVGQSAGHPWQASYAGFASVIFRGSTLENCYCDITFTNPHGYTLLGFVGNIYATSTEPTRIENCYSIGEEDFYYWIASPTYTEIIDSDSCLEAPWAFNVVCSECVIDIDFITYPKVAGVWKAAPAWVKVGGSWKSVTDGWIKDGGVWKKIIP